METCFFGGRLLFGIVWLNEKRPLPILLFIALFSFLGSFVFCLPF